MDKLRCKLFWVSLFAYASRVPHLPFPISACPAAILTSLILGELFEIESSWMFGFYHRKIFILDKW